jgi:hypothetical protein
MYDMYPQVWASGDASPATPPRPRRRPRKDHSVMPSVLVRHLEAEHRRSGR